MLLRVLLNILILKERTSRIFTPTTKSCLWLIEGTSPKFWTAQISNWWRGISAPENPPNVALSGSVLHTRCRCSLLASKSSVSIYTTRLNCTTKTSLGPRMRATWKFQLNPKIRKIRKKKYNKLKSDLTRKRGK